MSDKNALQVESHEHDVFPLLASGRGADPTFMRSIQVVVHNFHITFGVRTVALPKIRPEIWSRNRRDGYNAVAFVPHLVL